MPQPLDITCSDIDKNGKLSPLFEVELEYEGVQKQH